MQTNSATRNTYADAAVAVVVLLSVGMMIVPLPTWAIDLLIAANLALSSLLLLTALRARGGLGFSTLPTVLLVTTLYRLALNVSSTRLILLQADAGRVIRAFGDFVVRGDYVVGGVVFVILTIIQYVVVAKGAERVAEVSARFTLDALPGKQLAIDADVRAGGLGVEEASRLRAQLSRESQFYGAMDGAMKFVKGDAIAGIAIAGISLLGGTAIGVGLRGLPLRDSLQTYALLTIGDGLVSQIPSLVISTAAGLVVTRVAGAESGGSLGDEIRRELLRDTRVLYAGAAFLLVLGLVPGLPALPFLLISGLLALSARAQRGTDAAPAQAIAQSPPALVVELGPELATRMHAAGLDAALHARLDRTLARLCARLGVPPCTARVTRGEELGADQYAVSLRKLPLLSGQQPDATRCAAELEQDVAQALPARASELLSIDGVKALVSGLAQSEPELARALVPKPVSLSLLAEVLRRLLDEGVSVEPLARILETLAAHAAQTLDPSLLCDHVRRALRERLVLPHTRDGVLRVHRIDPLIEDAVRDAVQQGATQRYLALAPDLASDVIAAVRRSLPTEGAVLLTQPELRRFVRELLAPELPHATVLSYAELPPLLELDEREPIRV